MHISMKSLHSSAKFIAHSYAKGTSAQCMLVVEQSAALSKRLNLPLFPLVTLLEITGKYSIHQKTFKISYRTCLRAAWNVSFMFHRPL